MSKQDAKQKPLPSPEEMNHTTREENMEDFSSEWCQKLLNDPAYQHATPSTRLVDGPFGESFNSLLGRTLFTDQTLRAMKCLYKPGDKANGTTGEMLGLISIGNDMCSHTGVLHGGINTTIVDEVAGRLAVMEASQSLMAVNLNVNLRKSVKAPGIALVKAWIERPPEGRKVWVKCRIEQDEVTCVEAEGLWLKVNMYKM
jgi:acyl-coenzyme A thioesterase PaaI-like protein